MLDSLAWWRDLAGIQGGEDQPDHDHGHQQPLARANHQQCREQEREDSDHGDQAGRLGVDPQQLVTGFTGAAVLLGSLGDVVGFALGGLGLAVFAGLAGWPLYRRGLLALAGAGLGAFDAGADHEQDRGGDQ